MSIAIAIPPGEADPHITAPAQEAAPAALNMTSIEGHTTPAGGVVSGATILLSASPTPTAAIS